MKTHAKTSAAGSASRRRQRGSWQGILLGVIAGLIIAVIGLFMLASALLDEEITLLVRKDPAAQTHLGTVRECSNQFWASMADPRPDHLHYACEGTKGSAIAEVHTESTGPNSAEEIVSGDLVLADGKRVPLQATQTGQTGQTPTP